MTAIAARSIQTLTADQIVGFYGSDIDNLREGVISEHVEAFAAAGGRVVETSRRSYAVLPGGRGVPVLCSAIVAVQTEDDVVSGRCGGDAVDDGACPRHAAERDSWLATSEAERIAIERAEDRWR